MAKIANRHSRSFQFTRLRCKPWLRGHWVAFLLSLAPFLLSLLSLSMALSVSGTSRRINLLSSALLLSLGATLIQLPRHAGRATLTEHTLTINSPLTGKRRALQISRQMVAQISCAPLRSPPRWVPFAWGILELMCAAGAISAGFRIDGRGEHWTWLTVLAFGLSFWPWMVARWQTEMEIVLTYRRPGGERLGLIHAWATPHNAQSLVNMLRARAHWAEPADEEE